MSGEIRSFSREKIKHYVGLIEEILQMEAKRSKGRYELSTESVFPGFELDLTDSAVLHLSDCLRSIGLEPTPLRYHGGSDANILNNRSMKAINLGIGAKNPHATNEYIRVDHMMKMVALLTKLLAAEG
jgi:tripeptide aminopeptidase